MAWGGVGNGYTLPNMTYSDTAYSTCASIRQDWLEAVGKKSPTTLDELVDVLYAFKDAKLGGETTIPLGGSYVNSNPTAMLLYALGFDGGGMLGMDPAIVDGQAVIPAGHARFEEYLKLMNKFYNDGIINRDFYTLDATQTGALNVDDTVNNVSSSVGLVSGYNALFADPANLTRWWSIQPLTSEFSATPVWPGPAYFAIGNFVMSIDCEKPEAVMRFIDWLFTDEGAVLSEYGPLSSADDSVKMGYGGWYIKGTGYYFADVADVENKGGYSGDWDYMQKAIQGIYGGVVGDRRAIEVKRQVMDGKPAVGPSFDMTNSDRYARKANLEMIAPFYTEGYPSVIWLDEEATEAITDLKLVLEKYIDQECAKFITGIRPLNEFNDYLAELNRLGFAEYQQYYADAYQRYLNLL